MKVGFVCVLGRPNVGKSTLVNALLSKKVSIVTPRAQTTRDSISAILTEKDYQIVFVDTPGLFIGPAKLDKAMRQTAYEASKDVNLILYLLDASAKEFDTDVDIFSSLSKKTAKMIVLNKIDLIRPEKGEEIKAKFKKAFPDIPLIEATFKNNYGLKEIKEAVLPYLEEGDEFYPGDWYTDKDLAYQAKEVIREKLLTYLHKEIPHQCAVYIDRIENTEKGLEIEATILAEKTNHKAIIIGKGGSMIKEIRSSSYKELSRMWHLPIASIHLEVEVNPSWRNDPKVLAKLGYA